jgi:phosphoglucomutase
VKTIVTSEIQREVADYFGCRAEDFLTGFKWIAALMKTHEETGDGAFIFGGEDKLWYLGVPFVRDKDAVSSCLFFAEMTDC